MKLYVPNPQKWVDFFDHLKKDQTSSKQTGSGRRPSVLVINEDKSNNTANCKIKAVLPAEQTAAQAKSELEREDINPSAVVDMVQKPLRRRVKRIRRTPSHTRVKNQKGGARKRRTGAKKPKRTKHPRRNNVKAVIRKRDIFGIN